MVRLQVGHLHVTLCASPTGKGKLCVGCEMEKQAAGIALSLMPKVTTGTLGLRANRKHGRVACQHGHNGLDFSKL